MVANIRKMTKENEPAVKHILQQNHFGEIEYIKVAEERIAAFLADPQQSEYICVTLAVADEVCAYACYGHVAGTEGAFRLYDLEIAAKGDPHDLSTMLLQYIEKDVRPLKARLIIAEIHQEASLATLLPQNHFSLIGRIPSFFPDGKDLVFYVKYLDAKAQEL